MTIGLASCGKDTVMTEDGAFEFNGTGYASLQEAVDAALASQTDIGSGNGNIILVKDAYGDGAVVEDGFSKTLCIDFGSYSYTLSSGKSIETGNTSAFIKGSGGELVGYGRVLGSTGGELLLDGKVDILGDLETSSYTRFCEGYTGTFFGNITILDEDLYVSTLKGAVRIPTLTVSGADSFFMADTWSVPDSPVVIAKLVAGNASDSGKAVSPVSANCEGSVKIASGGTPHVHTYITKTIESDCMNLSRDEHICKDCGFVYVDNFGEEPGNCPKALLKFIPAQPATETSGGSISYWECPLCGRRYADPEGNNEITGNTNVLSGNYFADYALLHMLDDELNWRNEFTTDLQLVPAAEITGLVFTIAGFVLSAAFGIEGLVSTDDDKWDEVNVKLDRMQESLDRIEYKIDQLAKKIDIIPYKDLILSRNEKLNFLTAKSVVAFRLIDDYLKDESLSDEAKKDKIALVLND